ncbi:unnamed protein product [Gulo gulo]|uniref:Uncharacterized protein n=1 Tax=Gulo gulo TaxID=48420 RepID=A0A9X9PVH8_GULGU|nr:unnamed protein product [Gulo gulo]
MLRRARRFLFRSVPNAKLWKREASTRLGQIFMVYLGERSGPWISLHGCQQEQRHHLGKGHTNGVFGESQEVYPWRKNDLH